MLTNDAFLALNIPFLAMALGLHLRRRNRGWPALAGAFLAYDIQYFQDKAFYWVAMTQNCRTALFAPRSLEDMAFKACPDLVVVRVEHALLGMMCVLIAVLGGFNLYRAYAIGEASLGSILATTNRARDAAVGAFGLVLGSAHVAYTLYLFSSL